MENEEKKITYFDTNDLKAFIDTCRFIAKCNVDQRACILSQILMLSPILTFNPQTKSLDSVCAVSATSEGLLLTLGRCPHA